jgi:hypothetical protein
MSRESKALTRFRDKAAPNENIPGIKPDSFT